MGFLSLLLALAQVPMAHFDSNKSGATTTETTLTTSNVTSGRFGLLGKWTLDGYVFAQPLFIPAVGTHDLVIVGTLNNTVYAFDANQPGATIWSRNLGSPRTSYNGCCSGSTFFYSQPIGIVSTPVADIANNKLYVVNTNTTPAWVLTCLNLTTGAVIGSTVISGTVPGTGDSSSGGVVSFDPVNELQRPGLMLANGNVYICFGGVGDNRPWHGWVFAYGAVSLARTAIFCTTPNSFGGAVWPPGGPSIDGSGNVYVTTGNGGDYDGVTEFTNSVLKLSPALAILDWFEPSNNATLNTDDADMAAGQPILIPGSTLMVAAAKDFNVYVIDTTCMGHLQGSGGCALQTFKTNASGTITAFSGSYGGVFSSGKLFLPTTAGSIYQFACPLGVCNSTPTATQTNSYGSFGPAQMSLSSNGTLNGILWVVTSPTSTFTAVGVGTLRALNASTLSEIWNSGSTLGHMAKFVCPTIGNGKVFAPNNDNALEAFGLIPSTQTRGVTTVRGGASAR